MKEITRCGECSLCQKDMIVAKSISGEQNIINICWSLRRCVEKDDGCTFGLPKGGDDMGEVSDGYHTFNQLYHQRAVLFATIVNQNKDKSWKSFRHSDGNYCFDSNGEWFIVGIDTPQGSYTYHYSKEYWNMFDCEELEFGKEWDGHTEEDVTRLLSLEQEPKRGKWLDRASELDADFKRHDFVCSECAHTANYFVGGSEGWWDMEKPKYCPNCGARMEDGEE